MHRSASAVDGTKNNSLPKRQEPATHLEPLSASCCRSAAVPLHLRSLRALRSGNRSRLPVGGIDVVSLAPHNHPICGEQQQGRNARSAARLRRRQNRKRVLYPPRRLASSLRRGARVEQSVSTLPRSRRCPRWRRLIGVAIRLGPWFKGAKVPIERFKRRVRVEDVSFR